ncbi:DNA damage-binding protein 1 [Portunus trituberculatus]|uniref:DNA damage-binding protein 1 n=1 Tax=Portunus trituberculatus TaxID=210409 RepID=A0A5B7G7E1_PORTR|nr:DNA damage-binding protein 1 [Portunus trituberculatus]
MSDAIPVIVHFRMLLNLQEASKVTGTSCRLVNENTGQLVCEWRPPEGRNISVVAANVNQVVAAAGQLIYYIVIHPGALKLEA